MHEDTPAHGLEGGASLRAAILSAIKKPLAGMGRSLGSDNKATG